MSFRWHLCLLAVACFLQASIALEPGFINSSLPSSVYPGGVYQVSWTGIQGIELFVTWHWYDQVSPAGSSARDNVTHAQLENSTWWNVPTTFKTGEYQLTLNNFIGLPSSNSTYIVIAASGLPGPSYSSVSSSSTVSFSTSASTSSSTPITSSTSSVGIVSSSTAAQQTGSISPSSPHASGNLSTGEIVGSAIGAFSACLLLVIAGFFFLRRRRRLGSSGTSRLQADQQMVYEKPDTPSLVSPRPESYEMAAEGNKRPISYELPGMPVRAELAGSSSFRNSERSV